MFQKLHLLLLVIILGKQSDHIYLCHIQSILEENLLIYLLIAQEITSIVEHKLGLELLLFDFFNIDSENMCFDQFASTLALYLEVELVVFSTDLEDNLTSLGAEVDIFFGFPPLVGLESFVFQFSCESLVMRLSFNQFCLELLQLSA